MMLNAFCCFFSTLYYENFECTARLKDYAHHHLDSTTNFFLLDHIYPLIHLKRFLKQITVISILVPKYFSMHIIN